MSIRYENKSGVHAKIWKIKVFGSSGRQVFRSAGLQVSGPQVFRSAGLQVSGPQVFRSIGRQIYKSGRGWVWVKEIYWNFE